MPTYSFSTSIVPGDVGQTDWANAVGAALNTLGPLVGNVPVTLGTVAPSTPTYVFFKKVGSDGLVELWIEDGV